MSLKSRKRETIDPVSMLDLLAWWEAGEREHNRVITLELSLTGIGPGKRLSVVARASKPSLDPRPAPECEARLSWPTASHKTVMGLMMYLMMQLELQMEAEDELSVFSPADNAD